MPFQNSAGLGVNNFYGPRDTGGAVGLEHGENSEFILSMHITPEYFNGGYVPPVVIPKGALFRAARLRVDEAFTLTGTTPAIVYGAAGSETTNGFVVTAAELGTVGTRVPASTGTGTWSQTSTTGTTAPAKVGKVLTGANAAATVGAGRAVLVLHYFNKATL